MQIASTDRLVRGRGFHGHAAPALTVSRRDLVLEDCTFTAEDWPQVLVLEEATVTLRRCRVFGGSNRGLVVAGGTLIAEDCEFIGNRVAFWATLGARVALRRCRIEGPGSAGIFFQKHATGTVDDCTVTGVDDGAVVVRSGATPIFTDCTLAAVGVVAHYEAGGAGEMRGCTLLGGVTGVWVTAGAAPILRDCRISGASAVGVACRGDGRFERCRVEGSDIAVHLHVGANPVLADCDIIGITLGLCALDGARGRFDGCRVGPATLLMPGATTSA